MIVHLWSAYPGESRKGHGWLLQDRRLDAMRPATVLLNRLIVHGAARNSMIERDLTNLVNIINQAEEQSREVSEAPNPLSTHDVAAERIRSWYFLQMSQHGYQADDYELSDHDEEKLQRIAGDANMAIKRLAQMALRDVATHALSDNNKDFKKRKGCVKLASVIDQIFSGADLVVDFRREDGRFFPIAVKLAVTADPSEVTEIGREDKIRCPEFNKCYHRGRAYMDSIVFPVTPGRMAKFIVEYMDLIATGTLPSPKLAYDLFYSIEWDAPGMSGRSLVARFKGEVMELLGR